MPDGSENCAARATDEGRALMDPEAHVWACALAIEKQYGSRAPLHVAERIGALAQAGDVDGVMMWRAIAVRLAALTVRDGSVDQS